MEAFRLLLLLWWFVLEPGVAQVRHPLPVLWMMPVGGQVNLTAAVAPAVTLALQDLSRQPPPLGDYEIQIQLLDSQCDAAEGLKALFDAMWAGPRYLLVLGGACPTVTEVIARSLPALNLLQVSFAATSPVLSNRRLYGNLFSTVPSDRALNRATVKLLQRYSWTRVGVLTQEGPRMSEMKKDLITQLLDADVHVAAAESFSEGCSSLRKLKESDVRIVIAHFEEDSASEVFCCAYRLNLFGRRYQWILVESWAGWRRSLQVPGCGADGVLSAADGSIRLRIRTLSRSDTPGVSGRTPQEYKDAYFSRLMRDRSEVSPLHAFAYDAVWVAAKALSQAMEAVKHREKYSSVRRNFSVGEEEVQRKLMEAVKETQFEGVTGPVFFGDGERMTSIDVIQSQGRSEVCVGEFSTVTQQLSLLNHLLKFKGSAPVRDQTFIRLQRRNISFLLCAVVSSAAILTIVFALTVLCFSIADPKHRLQRASGGCQDELLLLGLLLSSSYILLSGLDGASLSDSTFDLLCSVGMWTLSVGHSVIFSVLFVRTWNVYSLHITAWTEHTQQRRSERSGFVVLWMFLLDVFVFVSWQILDPLRQVVSLYNLESDPADDDVIVRPFSERCSSINMELWLTAVYAYKAPLLGLGCFLAWNIRSRQEVDSSVPSEALAQSMAAVTLCSGLAVSGSLLTSHNPPLQFCLTAIIILSCNTFIMASLFGPKLLQLQAGGAELQAEAAEGISCSASKQQQSRLNRELRRRTAQLHVEIETITMRLYEMSDAEWRQCDMRREISKGEVRCLTSTHSAQISADDQKPSRPDDINAADHVGRRLSLQLPILHHSYLPGIGGVRSSCSSLLDSQEALSSHDALTATKTTASLAISTGQEQSL